MINPNNEAEQEIFNLAFNEFLVNGTYHRTNHDLYRELKSGTEIYNIDDLDTVQFYDGAVEEWLIDRIESLYFAIKNLKAVHTQSGSVI